MQGPEIVLEARKHARLAAKVTGTETWTPGNYGRGRGGKGKNASWDSHNENKGKGKKGSKGKSKGKSWWPPANANEQESGIPKRQEKPAEK